NPASLADLHKEAFGGKWSLAPADRSTGPLSVLKEKVLLDLDYYTGVSAAGLLSERSTYTVFVYKQDGKSKLKLVGGFDGEPALLTGLNRGAKKPLPATLGSQFGREYDKVN